MKALKSARTLAASLGVLAGVALAATPAMAFDKVYWEWKKEVKEYVDIDAYIDLKVDISGMVEVEKLQIFLGDLKAESTVKNIDNNSEHLYDKVEVPYQVKVCDYWGKNCYYKTEYRWETVKLALDATTQLPEVNSDAVAIGNLQQIESDVPVFLHDAQIVANTNGYSNDHYTKFDELLAYAGGYGSNLHTDLALAFTYGAVFGDLTPATIEAKSTVEYIKNASVDSTATAVGNYLSVTLESNRDGCGNTCNSAFNDHILIADITQFAYADIKATSYVNDVEVNGYSNLRKIPSLDKTNDNFVPLVNSVATAIGNAAIIKVGNVGDFD
jgi:hypothetical protein